MRSARLSTHAEIHERFLVRWIAAHRRSLSPLPFHPRRSPAPSQVRSPMQEE
jgi:hypothetical protein